MSEGESFHKLTEDEFAITLHDRVANLVDAANSIATSDPECLKSEKLSWQSKNHKARGEEALRDHLENIGDLMDKTQTLYSDRNVGGFYDSCIAFSILNNPSHSANREAISKALEMRTGTINKEAFLSAWNRVSEQLKASQPLADKIKSLF